MGDPKFTKNHQKSVPAPSGDPMSAYVPHLITKMVSMDLQKNPKWAPGDPNMIYFDDYIQINLETIGSSIDFMSSIQTGRSFNPANPANLSNPANPSSQQITKLLFARGAGGRGEALR